MRGERLFDLVIHDAVVGRSNGFGAEMPCVGPSQLVGAEPGEACHGVDPEVASMGHEGGHEAVPVIGGAGGGVVGMGELIEEAAPVVDFDEKIDEVDLGEQCVDGVAEVSRAWSSGSAGSAGTTRRRSSILTDSALSRIWSSSARWASRSWLSSTRRCWGLSGMPVRSGNSGRRRSHRWDGMR